MSDINNIEKYKKSKQNEKNYDFNISLNQGDKFNLYQNKIKKNILDNSKNNPIFSNKKIEGFSNNDNMQQLEKETKQVLENSQISENEQNKIDELLSKYQSLINQYNEDVKALELATKNFYDRIDSKKNPYLNKKITINGTTPVYYVTSLGVARYISSTSDCGKSTPVQNVQVKMKVPKSTPLNPKTTIPTNPSMIVGTPISNSSKDCNTSGKNVYVNSPADMDSIKYQKTVNDDSSVFSYLGGKPTIPTVVIINPNFSEPKLSNNSYKYLTKTIPGWYFNNGCLINNSTAWGYEMPYPLGPQACCIQNTSSVIQSMKLKPNTEYTLKFYAVGRPNYTVGTLAFRIKYMASSQTVNSATIPKWGYTNVLWQEQPPLTWTSYTISITAPNTTFISNGYSTYGIEFYGTDDGNRAFQIESFQSTTGSSGPSYTYNMCKTAAALNNYQYFGLTGNEQIGDSNNGLGYCAVSNDLVSINNLNKSQRLKKKKILWQSKTDSSSNPGKYVKLNSLGQLQVFDSDNKVIYSTPASGDSNYWGCYTDNSNRAIPNYKGSPISNADCKTDASQADSNGNAVYGIQDTGGQADGQCFIGTSWDQAREYGKATNCKTVSGSVVGSGWSNAVYGTQPGFTCFLSLQSDANMVIYRGQNASDNQGKIWASNTNFDKPNKNPLFFSNKGKYSIPNTDENAVYPNGFNGTTGTDTAFMLNIGEWVSSPKGEIVLMLENSGNLILFTSELGINNNKMDGNKLGGIGGVAVYGFSEVPAGTAFKDQDFAYLDGNQVLHSYTGSKQQNRLGKYNTIDSTKCDASSTIYQNMSLKDALDKCTNDNNCGGLTYENVTGDQNGEFYVIDPSNASKPNFSIENNWSCAVKPQMPDNMMYSDEVQGISGTKYNTYKKGQDIPFNDQYGLQGATQTQKDQLNKTTGKLNILAKELSQFNSDVVKKNMNLLNQTKKNYDGSEKYLKNIVSTDMKIEINKEENKQLNGIISDSNIKILMENYNYGFWSVIALAAVVGTVVIGKMKK